jgi:hypothetical protein
VSKFRGSWRKHSTFQGYVRLDGGASIQSAGLDVVPLNSELSEFVSCASWSVVRSLREFRGTHHINLQEAMGASFELRDSVKASPVPSRGVNVIGPHVVQGSWGQG